MQHFFIRFVFIFLGCVFINTGYATPQNEEISTFNSHITVNTDASIDVVEVITVYANRVQIIHGIVRRLPISYVDSYGIERNTKYKITDISLNGIKPEYNIRYGNDELSIYIGNDEIVIKPGIYTYSIKYHVNNAVNFLQDVDEIYWNISGNNWSLPIKQIQAIIDLPNGAIISHDIAYTGFKDQKGNNYQANKPTYNRIEFVTTTTLTPGQGLTVAVAWQKNIVTQPTWKQLLLKDLNKGDYITICLTFLILIYFFMTWYSHGRDFRNRTTVPLYEPPKNLTPEAIRYIVNMNYDNKTFTTALISIASRGHLTINQSDDRFTLIKNPQENSQLPPEEIEIMNVLFSADNKISLSNANMFKINKAQSKLVKNLTKTYKKLYFKTNSLYAYFGTLISLIAFVLIIYHSDFSPPSALISLFIISFTVVFVLFAAFSLYALFSHFTRMNIHTAFTAIAFLLLTICFLAVDVYIIYLASNYISLIFIISIVIICLANLLFSKLLYAPTVQGREIINQIDGFRMFLAMTERYRLNLLNSPEMTQVLFEKYLPYAIALDVENEWCTRFNDVLVKAGTAPASYHPSWYSGPTSWTANSLNNIQTAMNSSVSSSRSMSGSSSASGGSGSSGGGGGGGGGGGW